MFQACSVSAATGTATYAIPKDPTIKVIFAASGTRMKYPDTAALRSMDIIIIEIFKSKVAMLYKSGSTIVNQGVKYYSMSVVALSPRAPDQFRAGGDYRINPGGEVNPPYLLTAPTSGDVTGYAISNENYDEPNTVDCCSSVFLASPMSSGDHNRVVDSPDTYNGVRDNIDDDDHPTNSERLHTI